MNKYHPDSWVMLKFTSDADVTYKVLASWYGGYLGGDSWQLNSGVTSVEEDGKYLCFAGSSGSTYICHKNSYSMSAYTSNIYAGFVKKFAGSKYTMKLCDKDTDFMAIYYE